MRGLTTGDTHIIRVTTVRAGLDLIIPLEIDLDDDPDNDDQIRLRQLNGAYDIVVTADSKQVREHEENPLALYRFRDVPPGKYEVSVNVGGHWRPVIVGLEVTSDSVLHGGKKYESKEDGAEFGNPEDPPVAQEDADTDEGVPCTH